MSDTQQLRVSIDVTAIPERPAGGGRYALELVNALSQRSDIDLVSIARRGDGGRWRAVGSSQDGGDAGVLEVVEASPKSRPLRIVWEQARLPALLRRIEPQVHHGPHYTMPEHTTFPVVTTVHDCTFFDHPEWHQRTKVLFFRRAIRVAARRASVIVCGSEATEERLKEICQVTGPVLVAPYGVDLEKFSPDEPFPGADEKALAGLGLDTSRPLISFLGTLEPRKGVVTLIEAFDRLAPKWPDALLVLAGQRGWGTEIPKALASATHPRQIVSTGYLPDDCIPALLRQSALVAYPSFGEGYGLPALEAIACGAQLVTTQGTPMASMVGQAALLVPPGDVGALAEAMEALLEARGTAQAQVRRRLGLELAATRTWAASAAIHVSAYRLAAQSDPG